MADNVERLATERWFMCVSSSYLRTAAEQYLLDPECLQAASSKRARAGDLSHFLLWRENHGLIDRVWSRRDTQAFLQDYREGEDGLRAAATYNRMLSTLRSFASWISQTVYTSQVAANALAGITGLRLVQVPRRGVDVVEKTLRFDVLPSRDGERNLRDRAILSLRLLEGMGCAQIASLTEYGTILVRRQMHFREQNGGLCRVGTISAGWILAYLERERGLDDPRDDIDGLFVTIPRGRPPQARGLSERQIQRIVTIGRRALFGRAR